MTTHYDTSINDVYTFTDALKAVQEMLNVAREERDATWISGEYAQEKRIRAEAIEDVLTALSIENTVRHYIAQGEEREG